MIEKNYTKLVETWIPLNKVNFDGIIEMAFKFLSRDYHAVFEGIYGFKPRAINTTAPRIRNLHPWPARRPCGVARVLNVLATLPSNINGEKVEKILGLSKVPNLMDEKLPPIMFYINPDRETFRKILVEKLGTEPEEIVVIDPMAGGGSIPLESLRYGFKTIAIEYNPVAYIILKATLEYPAKYGVKLYEDVKNEARKLIEFAKKELGKYYPEDAYNYIFARGFICLEPECKGLVPIIHGIRLGKRGPYIKFNFDKEKKTFTVDVVKEETIYEKLRCPYCGTPFVAETVFKQWVKKHKQLLKHALSGDEEAVEKASKELLKVYIPLVKQTKKGFVPCDDKDKELFLKAYKDLALQTKKLKQFIPSHLIPNENEVFKPVRNYGIKYWYELFNPRQLLVLAKLIRYVTKRSHELIEERGEYGAAISIYLAFGIDKIVNYNNICSTWHSSHSVIHDIVEHYSRTRQISLGLEHCEAKRIDLALSWVFEPDVVKPTATHGGLCPVVKLLCEWLEGLGDKIEIYMADARQLPDIFKENYVDVINVDPPYLDQHSYSDLSEFFWQILMLTLKPAIKAGYLFNRDKSRGRVECLVKGWNPLLSTVPRKDEIIARKSRISFNSKVPYSKEWYKEQIWKFFNSAYKVLKDDGILILWYTHTDPEAWETILSGLYASNFTVSRIWTVRTEMGQRRVALAGSAFFTSMVLIARKKGERIIVGATKPEELVALREVNEVIERSVIEALECAKNSGASEKETFIMSLAGALAGATLIYNPFVEEMSLGEVRKLEEFIEEKREEEITKQKYEKLSKFYREKLYPIALYLGVKKTLEKKLAEANLKDDDIKLILNSDLLSLAYLIFWVVSRVSEQPKVNYDFVEKICKVLGIRRQQLSFHGLLYGRGKQYLIPYVQDSLSAVKGKLEVLDKTVAGKALLLTDAIVKSPIKDVERCVEYILSFMPVGKQEANVALFLLRTAKEEELEKSSITKLSKGYIEKVLEKICER